jgi:hypothetical protein
MPALCPLAWEADTMNHPSGEHEPPERREQRDPPEVAPEPRATDLPKPFGDAVPAPTEPGLDQPLPPKSRTRPECPAQPASGSDDEAVDAPPNDISRPLGDAVPTPEEPGLDQPLPAKKSS